MDHCCERMKHEAEQSCPDHPNPADCPDHLVAFDKSGRPIGLWVHDGGESYVEIQWCPWCGTSLQPKP